MYTISKHCQCVFLHTYIHNWPLQPFSWDYGIASHTTHVVCINFIRKWRDLQFNIDSEREIFENFFLAGLFTLRVLPEFCREEIAEEILFVFLF